MTRKDILPGGKADKKEVKDFDPASLRKGQKVEREHVDNKTMQREIAMDHLTEDPKYYEKLEKMEKKAFWDGFSKQASFTFTNKEQFDKMRKLLKPDEKSVKHLQAAKDRVAKVLEQKNLAGHSTHSLHNTAAGKGMK